MRIYFFLCLFFIHTSISTKIDITQIDVFGRFTPGKPQQLQHAGTKYQMPRAIRMTSSRSGISFARPAQRTATTGQLTIKSAINHPGAGQLFPDNAGLQGLFSTFLNGIDQDPYFTVFFARFHLLILHQLYQYLLRIYSTFNLSTTPDLEQYLEDQATYALNRKTIIINHLINIIEAQTNGAILAKFPRMPKELATHTGALLMQNDYGTDLNIMLEEYELQMFNDDDLRANGVSEADIKLKKDTFKSLRSDYSKLFGKYLRFAREHCMYLSQPSNTNAFTGLSQFVAHAEKIKTVMDAEIQKIEQQVKAQKAGNLTQNIDLINPPIFFYDAETMRGIKVIPAVAQSLPANTASVGWPSKATQTLVNTTFGMAASESSLFGNAGSPYDNKKIAFYAQPDGTIIDSTPGPRLFVRIMTAEDLYAQELYKQPAWMNSNEGILKITRACLGDFSILLDPELRNEPILDPCLFCVLTNAARDGGITVQIDGGQCNGCSNFLQGIRKELDAIKKATGESIDPNALPPTPDDGSGTLSSNPFGTGDI